MSNWTADMEDIFADLVSEFGIAGGLSFNGQTGIDCVLTPYSGGAEMTQGPYVENADTQIDVLRSDADTCGLLASLRTPSHRAKVTVTRDAVAKTFQVLTFDDDDTADPCIKLYAKKLQ